MVQSYYGPPPGYQQQPNQVYVQQQGNPGADACLTACLAALCCCCMVRLAAGLGWAAGVGWAGERASERCVEGSSLQLLLHGTASCPRLLPA